MHKSILLIEDDLIDVEHIKMELAKLKTKFTLQIAGNGAEGLEILTDIGKRFIPDVILLNLNMPKMNGFEFLRIIKSYHTLKRIKIYVISTSREEYDKLMVMNSGADGYITKPLSFTETNEQNTPAEKLKAELEAK